MATAPFLKNSSPHDTRTGMLLAPSDACSQRYTVSQPAPLAHPSAPGCAGSKLLLANRVARLFVVSYLVLLHLFVLAMLYYMSSSESPEVNMALLAPLAAPAAASPVIESRVEAIASSVADAAGTLSQAVSSLGKLGASSSD